MCILILFNENSTITLDTIRSSTEIPELELKRHLLSLCTPKLRILKKLSKGKVGYIVVVVVLYEYFNTV